MEFAFDERNLLHPGVHDASMRDVRTLFGKFQRSDRRINLFKRCTALAKKKRLSRDALIARGLRALLAA